MVNFALMNQSKKNRAKKQAEFAARKNTRFREVLLGESGTHNFRIISSTYVQLPRHRFSGGKLLRSPHICDVDFYGKKKCKVCEDVSENSDYGNNPNDERIYLAYFPDLDGKPVTKKNGQKIKLNGVVLLAVPPKPKGRLGPEQQTMIWDVFDKADKKGKLTERVWQLDIKKWNWVGPPQVVPPDELEEYDGGRIPKAIRKSYADLLAEVDDDGNHILLIPHLIHTSANVKWDDWELDEPVIKKGALDEKDDAGFDPDDDDDSDDDEDDEDEDEDDRPKKKVKSKSRGASRFKKRSKDEDEDEDDEDDDEDDEEDEDEDDEDEKPSKKSKSKPKPKSKVKSKQNPKPKKKSSRDEDDDDEDDDEDEEEEDDDEDDEDDDEDDEDEDEDEKPKSKSKSKSKSSARDDEEFRPRKKRK